MLRRSLSTIICLLFVHTVLAQGDSILLRGSDTLHYSYTPISEEIAVTAGTPAKSSFWDKIARGNVDRTFDRKIDLSFIGAPSYTKEASVGLGLLVSGLYRVDRTDSLTPPSDVSLFGNVSVSGFYMVGISGNTLFSHNRSRVVYEVSFASKPLDFWGIGYDAGHSNERSDYLRRQVKFDAGYLYSVWKCLYVGGHIQFAHTKASKIDSIAVANNYFEGQKYHYTATGIGVSLQYDTRDYLTAPQKGVYLMVKQMVYPKGLGNCTSTLYKTVANADYYHRLWKGAVLAWDVYGEFNSEDTPWPMLAELGGSYRMRGYYQGKYMDNNLICAQVEYRQYIGHRIGCVVWGGAGNVFRSFNDYQWGHTLPNYGLGLRWEFKQHVNVRIDYGFGKKTSGLVFNINEAF